MEDEINEMHARMCRVFTNPNRLKILSLLMDQERSAGDIEKLSGINQSNLSQHLSLMKNAGILKQRREGATIHYSLRDARIGQAFKLIRTILLDRLSEEGRMARSAKGQGRS